jgi:hypothetical protein
VAPERDRRLSEGREAPLNGREQGKGSRRRRELCPSGAPPPRGGRRGGPLLLCLHAGLLTAAAKRGARLPTEEKQAREEPTSRAAAITRPLGLGAGPLPRLLSLREASLGAQPRPCLLAPERDERGEGGRGAKATASSVERRIDGAVPTETPRPPLPGAPGRRCRVEPSTGAQGCTRLCPEIHTGASSRVGRAVAGAAVGDAMGGSSLFRAWISRVGEVAAGLG